MFRVWGSVAQVLFESNIAADVVHVAVRLVTYLVFTHLLLVRISREWSRYNGRR